MTSHMPLVPVKVSAGARTVASAADHPPPATPAIIPMALQQEGPMSEQRATPLEDGFSMPAEWEPHEACLMEWPTLTREAFWAGRFEEAKRDYATVANAIVAFEPVVMVCDPEQEAEVRRHCGDGVEALPLPIDDSWMRDNGPIFVRDAAGRIALVHFRFNSWGEKYLPYD